MEERRVSRRRAREEATVLNPDESLTELPLGLPGRLFRCAMPFSGYDPAGRTFDGFRAEAVRVVVVLVGVEECERLTGRDLYALYRDEGIDIVALPIPDFGATDVERAREVVARVLDHLRAGRNVAVHCHAGRGRAGAIIACVAREVLGLGGLEVIAWLRSYVPGAIETSAQVELVVRYGEA